MKANQRKLPDDPQITQITRIQTGALNWVAFCRLWNLRNLRIQESLDGLELPELII